MRIAILHASAGHGHTKAAEAIREGLLACGVPASEILVLDALGETPAWFRRFYTSLYYFSVKHTPATWGLAYDLMNQDWFYDSLGGWGRRLVNDAVGENLIRRMEKENPDLIFSTHFLAPEILGRAKQKGRIRAFLITVVTDFLPHRFWMNSGTNHYWVMSDEGRKALEAQGIPSQKITAGGIPVSLKFRTQDKKPEVRKKEGLAPDKFTLLITSGSFGLGPTAEVLSLLREFNDRIQVMVVCGKNEDLFRSLEKESYPFRFRLYGFTSHMDELMEASDLLVAKPGGATTSECLAKGVAMVVLEPIPGQESGNARVLRERNAAFFMVRPEDIRVILKGILDHPQVLEEKKRSIHRLARPEAALELGRFALGKVPDENP